MNDQELITEYRILYSEHPEMKKNPEDFLIKILAQRVVFLEEHTHHLQKVLKNYCLMKF